MGARPLVSCVFILIFIFILILTRGLASECEKKCEGLGEVGVEAEVNATRMREEGRGGTPEEAAEGVRASLALLIPLFGVIAL